MSQSNQDKVKQDIVSYILHKDGFSQVQNGKFWKDLKDALKLKQNYLSLKSLFFLAILKDIKNQHVIYSLTEEERKKFVALIKNTKKPLEETQIPDILSTQDSSYYRDTASESRNVNDAKGARVLPSFLKSQNTPKETNNKKKDRKSQSQNHIPTDLDEICSYNTSYSRDSFLDSFVAYAEPNHPHKNGKQRRIDDSPEITDDEDSDIEDIRETFRTIMEKGYNERMFIDYSNPNWINLIYQDNNDIDECELPVYDIPHLKRKGSQNKTKTRKRNSAEKISNLRSSKRSKLNEIPLIPPLLLSSTRVEPEKQSENNSKTVENATNTLHSAVASARNTNTVTERVMSPISTQLNIERELINNENNTGTRVSVMDADLNEFGSPRSTQDLYMQADMELNKEANSDTVTQNNNHLPFKSNNVTIGNVTKNLKTTSRGGIQNGQLKFNREELRKDTYISNLLNILIKHTSNAANKAGVQKSNFIELDQDNLYLDISNLSDVDISLIPGSQELFDWMKSGNSEEPTANENVAGSTLGDVSEFKLKHLLKKSHSKKKTHKEGDVVLENTTKNTVSTATAPAPSTESQELDLVNNEIANFLGNMKKTTVNPAVIDAPVNNVKDGANKDMFEPPKAPVNSSFDQECAIEDITDGSMNRKRTLRKRDKTKAPNVVPALKVRTKSPEKVEKRPRKKLYTTCFTLDEDEVDDVIQHRKDEYRLHLEKQGEVQGADIYFPIDKITKTKTHRTSPACKKSQKYSLQESKTLLAFLIEGDRFKQIRSDETWQKIAKLWITFFLCNPKLSVSPRNQSSLKNHYFRTMLPNLTKYGLSPEQIHLLKSYSKESI